MINKRMLFDENYGLAATQSLKNKDIPEGGAKGTILPSCVIFRAILDVLLLVTQSWSTAQTLL
jgi:NAD-specific glutamate dehydrogenase